MQHISLAVQQLKNTKRRAPVNASQVRYSSCKAWRGKGRRQAATFPKMGNSLHFRFNRASRPVSHGDAEAGEESDPTRRRRTDEESRRHFTSLAPFLSPTSDFQPDSIFEKRPEDAGPVSMDDSWGGGGGGADNPAGLLFRLETGGGGGSLLGGGGHAEEMSKTSFDNPDGGLGGPSAVDSFTRVIFFSE